MMATTNSITSGGSGPLADSAAKNPHVGAIKGAASESMDFMAWTSAQASSLAKLKIFHTMAKQINDQQ
jgi:hypothetical protein